MKQVQTYQAIEKALRDFVLNRVFPHSEVGFLKDYPMTYAQIDELLAEIDKARGTGEEPGSEADLKNVKKAALQNLGQFAPIIGGISVGRALDGVRDVLKTSAQADLVRAIIACERFMIEVPDEVDRGNRILGYNDKLRDLMGEFDEDSEKSEPEMAAELLARTESDLTTAFDSLLNIFPMQIEAAKSDSLDDHRRKVRMENIYRYLKVASEIGYGNLEQKHKYEDAKARFSELAKAFDFIYDSDCLG